MEIKQSTEERDIQNALIRIEAELMPLMASGDVEIVVRRKARTSLQNRAIHKYCGLLAEAYNDAGLDKELVLKQQADVPWTMEGIKDDQWRPIMIALGFDCSTTKLKTDQVSKVYDVLNRHTINNFEISVPFPSLDAQSFDSL